MFSHYHSLAHQLGSPDALALAPELGAWHDRMVAHQRAIAAAIGRRCDDGCPHAEAVDLWRQAVQTYGEAAERLVFLKNTAATAQRWQAGNEARANALRAGAGVQ